MIMSPANRNSLTSCPNICILLVSFPCLMVLDKTYSTELNSNNETEHPCLVAVTLKMLLTSPPFIWRNVPSIDNFLQVLIMKLYILSNAFPEYTGIIVCVLFFDLLL